MRHKVIPVSKAKAKLLELTRRVSEEGDAYLLTKDGEPVSALVPLEDYEALTETMDVLTDSQTMMNLRRALVDERKSRLWKRDKKGRWAKAKRIKRAA